MLKSPRLSKIVFFNDWLGYLYFERIVYKNDGYKGEKLLWADKTVLCTTSHMLEW